METILQISVDNNVLMRAQEIAMGVDKTVPELLNDYLLSITKKRTNEVNSYEELVAALEEGQKAIDEGRFISFDEWKKHVNKRYGVDFV